MLSGRDIIYIAGLDFNFEHFRVPVTADETRRSKGDLCAQSVFSVWDTWVR